MDKELVFGKKDIKEIELYQLVFLILKIMDALQAVFHFSQFSGTTQ